MKKKFATVVAVLLAMVVALPAFGAPFVPSIQQKTTPAVIQQKNKNGKNVNFLIFDEAGNEIDGDGKWSEDGKTYHLEDASYQLVVVSYNDKDKEGVPAALKEAVEKLYEQIKSIKSFDELSADVTKYLPEGVKLEDLAASEVFVVGFVKNGTELVDLSAIGASSISVNLEGKSALMYLVSAGEGWTVDKVNGSITLKVAKSLTNVVFLAKNTQGETSPKTGYEANTGIFVGIAAVAAVVAVAGVVVIGKKRAK